MVNQAQFSDAKQRLLEKFLRGEAARQNWEAPVLVRTHGQTTPLAPVQQQVWLNAQVAPDTPTFNEPATLSYHGILNRDAFVSAYQEVLRRHEIWRTSFAAVNGEVVQAIQKNSTVEVPFFDLTPLPEREAEFLRIASEDVRRPFDLSVGPLVRPKLFRMGPEDFRFHLTMHHIVFDGVTINNVLVPELTALYEAFAAGLPTPLAEPKLQYGDYAVWQTRFLENESDARQIEFWRRELAGPLPELQLPLDRPRPPQPSYTGGLELFSLPQELSQALKQIARAEGVTIYMLLLAAFKTLLHRYSNQDEVLVGAQTDLRRRAEFQKLMGFFLNTVVLRTRPSGDMTFRHYLSVVKDTVLNAFAHSDVPFDRVVRDLHPKRDPGRHPFFQTMFLMEPPAPSVDSRWDLKQGNISSGAAKYDLYLGMEDRPEGFSARLLYNHDVFDVSTIHGLVGHWRTLLAGIAQDPETRLADLPLLTAEETHRICVSRNATNREIPPTTMHEMFEMQAARTPRAIAVECDDVRLSYGELNQEANRLARRLQEAGVGPESIVGLCVERSCDLVLSLLAILKAGGAYLPIDPGLPRERQDLMFEDTRSGVVVASRTLAEHLPPNAGHIVYCDEGSGNSKNPGVKLEPDNLAYVLYTSGSTGRPKGVEIPHHAMVNFLQSMQKEPGFKSSDTLLALTTISFDIATLEMFLPLVSGGRVVVATQAETRDPAWLIERMRESRCTVMQATPATWRALIEAGWNGTPGLKVLCGGEAMARDLAEALLPRCEELWNMYGPTETTIWSAVQRVTSGSGFVSIGHPIDNTQIHILDRHLRPVPDNVIGELYIGGSGLARGYLCRPELTSERFLPAPAAGNLRVYRTGDLARYRPDGTLECLGRADHQIKVRGYRIEPEEIEAALRKHPLVREAAVRAWPDSSGNMSLTAYVLASEDANWRHFLQGTLPDYMVPARFMKLDELPMTPNGKVDRKGLPEPSGPRACAEFRGPSHEVERRLVQIWEQVLEISSVDVRENFFDLGGHSLLVAKMIRRIELEFGVRLTMGAIFQAPTVEQLANVLRSDDLEKRTPRTVRFHATGTETPLLWAYAGPLFRPLADHIGKDRPFIGVCLDPSEQASLAPDCTLEQVAACLVKSIRSAQPHGPYLLGGWCATGLMAYEAGVQLKAAGEEVALVVILDSVNPTHFRRIPNRRLWASKLHHHIRVIRRLARGKFWNRDAWSYAKDRFLGGVVVTSGMDKPDLTSFNGKFEMAALNYDPNPYDGPVVIIEPTQRPQILDLRESWASIDAPDLEVVGTSGNHVSVLSEENAAELAACISRKIASVELNQEEAPMRAAV